MLCDEVSASGLLIDDDGQILWQEHPRALMPVYSLTKTAIALAVLESGMDLSSDAGHWLDLAVSRYQSTGGAPPTSDSHSAPTFARSLAQLPALLNAQVRDATIAQLLSHRAGLCDYGALPAYGEAILAGEPPWSDAQFAAHTTLGDLLYTPGSGWSYSNPGFWLLCRFLEVHRGQPIAQVLQDLVLTPLGMARTVVAHGQFAADLPDYPAQWVWHGLLLSTAQDMLRMINSERVAELRQECWPVPYQSPGWHDPHYGFGLMVDRDRCWGHAGGGPAFSAACFHFPKERVTGCVLMRARVEDAAPQRLFSLVDQYTSASSG